MSSIFEIAKVRIKTKSPVHIGSELGKISRFEFLVDGSFVYPVSEDRLSKFLLEKNLIQDYVNEVEEKGNRFNLQLFLRNKRIVLTEQDRVELSNGRKIKVFGNPDFIVEFRPFIRDGFSNIYIPGTSLKGSIRTAIFYNILRELKNSKQDDFKNIEDRINTDINERKKPKNFFEWAEKDFLQNFELFSKKKEPNTDWLRMLHISDAYPLRNIQTVLIPVNVIKKEQQWRFKQENNQRPTTIWIECVPEGTLFEFEMMWDKSLMKEFNNVKYKLPKKISDVITAIESFSKDMYDYEKKFLEGNTNLLNWYNQTKANFRIGFGSGMISTTVIMLVNEQLRKKIRDFAGQRREDEAPKSRRIWNNNNQYIPLGWTYLEKEPFEETKEEQKYSTSTKVDANEVIQNTKTVHSIEKKTHILDAKLTWNPGNKTLFAEAGQAKASIKLDDPKSFIPEEFHKKLLEKRDWVQAKVEVEQEGNMFKILKIIK